MTTNSNIQPQNQAHGLGPLLAGAIVGLMVGGIAVLLTAPQPGVKTRAELQHGIEQFRDRTTDAVKEKVTLVKTKADHLQGQGRVLIVQQLDRISQLAESGKKAIKESADHVAV